MGIELIVMMALSVGASYLAASLAKKPKQKGFVKDDKPTTLADRGSFLPLIIGRRRVGYLFAFAGNRIVKKEATGSTGGKGGGGSKTTYTNIYHEDGWHQLCVGPAQALYAIRQDGIKIWEGSIDRATTPSGSTVAVGKEGSFTIYWGDCDQPLNPTLAAALGINSRWPHICYIYWNEKRLGQQARWPALDYELEVLPAAETDVFGELYTTSNITPTAGQTTLWNRDAVEVATKKWEVANGNSTDNVQACKTLSNKDVIVFKRSFTKLDNIVRQRYSDGAILWSLGQIQVSPFFGDAYGTHYIDRDERVAYYVSSNSGNVLAARISDGVGVFNGYPAGITVNHCECVSVLEGQTRALDLRSYAASLPSPPNTVPGSYSEPLVWAGNYISPVSAFTRYGIPNKWMFLIERGDITREIGVFAEADATAFGSGSGDGPDIEWMFPVHARNMLVVLLRRKQLDAGAPMQTASGFVTLMGYDLTTEALIFRAETHSNSTFGYSGTPSLVDENTDFPKILLPTVNSQGSTLHSLRAGEEGAEISRVPSMDGNNVQSCSYDQKRDIVVVGHGGDHYFAQVPFINSPSLGTVGWRDRSAGEIPGGTRSGHVLPLENSAFDSEATINDGVAPDSILKQLMTGTFPHGVGIEPGAVDLTAMDAARAIATTEGLGMNVLFQDGLSAAEAIADVLQDAGAMIYENGWALKVKLIRVETELPLLTEDFILPPEPILDFTTGPRRTDRMVFVFKDISKNFRDVDIQVDDDSSATQYGRPNQRKMGINSVTKFDIAAAVANRRQQEEMASLVGYQFNVTRDAADMRPGESFQVENIGTLLCISIDINPQDRKAKIDSVMNYYGQQILTFIPGEGANSAETQDVEPDDPFFAIETPFTFNNGQDANLAISVLRNRAHNEIIGSDIFMSIDGITYDFATAQDAFHPGGTLDEVLADEGWIIEDGPLFTTDDPAGINQVQDLTGSDVSWRTGLQVAVIKDPASNAHEIFFLRAIEAVGPNQFRLKGLLRGRAESDFRNAAIGDRVFILNPNELRQQLHQFIRLGETVLVKSQPKTSVQIEDLADVTEQSVLIEGNAYRPLPVENFYGNFQSRGPVNEYDTGADVLFRWGYRIKPGRGLGAGELGAGIAIGEEAPEPEGTFELEILTLGNVQVRLETGLTATTFNYTNTNIVSDLGSEVSFKAKISHVNGAYRSRIREITITKV